MDIQLDRIILSSIQDRGRFIQKAWENEWQGVGNNL
jgi:hypothetical protein